MFLIFLAACSLLAATIIILKNFNDNLVFFYSPTDLKSKQIATNQVIRIGGLVKEGSVQKQQDLLVTFIITDQQNEIKVSYQGILPTLFREGQGMVATGNLHNKNNFVASNLLAKHDENYMPPEVAKALKESGKWRHNNTQENGSKDGS